MRPWAPVAVTLAALATGGCAATGARPPLVPVASPAPPMVVVAERDVMVRERPPHGAIGMSTAFRISDAAPPPRRMEFRRRVLDPGAAIGAHPIAHDEVYYVTAGQGIVVSDGVEAALEPGMATYLYEGAVVGIRQTGDAPLSIVIAYPVRRED